MRADLDAAMANVRLGAEQKAAILAAAKGAGELSRKRRSIRTVMAVAALCSVLAATALAASPTLRETLEEVLREGKVLFRHTFPYDKAGEIQRIRKYGELLCEDYREDGIYVEAYVPADLM